MKKFWLGAMVTAAVGCNNVEVGLVVEEVPPPTAGCGFRTGEVEWPLTFDSQRMSQMFIPTEVTNVMSTATTRIVRQDPLLTQQFPTTVTPLRFDFRWECDASGFTAGQGPLILPAFSVDNPFCLDTRDESNADFAGFDVVSASGPPVGPGETVIWLHTPITAQLGEALNVAFRLAELSQACCDLANGCENARNFATTGACQDLQNLLDSVAPNQFSVQQPETLNIWRPYFLYTAAGAATLQRGSIPNFPLRLRGVYEGITAAGDLITSTEFIRDIGVCKGAPVGQGDRCTLSATELCFQSFVN